jgi:hypothetical protein
VSISFDFHTMSVTLDQTLAEYRGQLNSELGLHVWERVSGDRSKTLRFRHEHAHFTSFMASGLSDLYGVFSDYVIAFLYLIVRRELIAAGNGQVLVPLLADRGTDSTRSAVIERAWKQINVTRSFFLGFGTQCSFGELTDLQPQFEFWELYSDLRFVPRIQRYFELATALAPLGFTAVELADRAALPAVTVQGRTRQMTSRAVMEAYALTIELLNAYFRGVWTESTYYSSPVERKPGPLYTVAIEYVLECHAAFATTTLDDVLRGAAPIEVYYTIAALSFAAMQVPVFQQQDGNVRIDGNADTLCPAYRFKLMTDAMARHDVPPLPNGVRSEGGRADLLHWLRQCHAAIGDTVSMQFYEEVHDQIATDPAAALQDSIVKTPIELTWAARENFFESPGEYIFDAGLFAERYPSQLRYVRSSDGKLLHSGEDLKLFQARYLDEHSVPLLEAAVFDQSWDATWAKMPEILPSDRARTIADAFSFASYFFMYHDEDGSDPEIPAIDLAVRALR